MDDAYTLTLTEIECLYLSDRLSFASQSPDGTPLHPDLLLKIGCTFLTCHASDGPSDSAFLLNELWALREVCKAGETVGGKPIGFELLTRIYSGIVKLTDDAAIPLAVAQEVEDRPYKERASLEKEK